MPEAEPPRYRSALSERMNQRGIRSPLSLADLREPAMQRYLTDPGTPTTDLFESLLGTDGAMPDAFAVHQVSRVWHPERYASDKRYRGFHSTQSWRFNWNYLRYGRGVTTYALQFQDAFLAQLRPSLLELNRIIAEGQNPVTCDWERFRPGTPQENA